MTNNIEFVSSIVKDEKKNFTKIVKHNNLIQSKYTLTALEQKLLYRIFEDIQRSGYTNREVVIEFKNLYRDYKEIVRKNISKKEFQKILHSIQDKPVEIIKDNDYTRTHWYSLNAPKDLSRFSIKIDEDVFSYVQSLNTNFTTLLSESLYSFSSFYTMRIYELLQQWYPKKKQIAYRMQTLKEYLQLDYRVVIEKGVEKELNKSYRNNSNFNKRIIEPAIKEINEHSELSVTYEFLRNSGKGKSKIEGICFYVDSKENKEEKILKEIKDPQTQIKEETKEKTIDHEQTLEELFENYLDDVAKILFMQDFKETWDLTDPDVVNRIAYCIEDMFSLYAISQITEDMYYQFKTLCKFELNKWLLS